MPLKNIPISERPREKAMQKGVSSLSDAELVALLLRSGIKNCSVLELANQLLVEFGGLSNLFNTDIQLLMKVKGISKVKALDLKVCYELATRLNKDNKNSKKRVIQSTKQVFQQYRLFARQSSQEFFYVIYLDTKLQVLQEEKLFVGGLDRSVIDLKVIFKKAILCNACKIICFHNHPSGDSKPSKEDYAVTQSIVELGKVCKVTLLDHIIFGSDNYYSILGNQKYFDDIDNK